MGSSFSSPVTKAVPKPSFLEDQTNEVLLSGLRALITNASPLSDESLVKITRQLEFWYKHGNLPDEAFLELARRLVDAAHLATSTSGFKVPTTRFGRTEIEMPIVTTGGMRVQQSWFPDNVPLLSLNEEKVLKSASQENLKEMIRLSLKLGMNHFETARMYGTSELQFADALHGMVTAGEIKRSDFILQTKIVPCETIKEFEKSWLASWKHLERFEYIDLFSFHVVSLDHQVDWVLNENESGLYSFISNLKKKGLIHHIGFSTHGSAENIMRLIESNRFDYVNLHAHYFGSYHGEGTPDTLGGHGNIACVNKAKELDMGLFLISPYDKGGALYKPTKKVALAVGEKLNPMVFASLYAWKKNGFHTISVGIARLSDFVECCQAALLYHQENILDELDRADKNLRQLAMDKLGAEWFEKGLHNIPSYLKKESNGVAIGHTFWCYNLLVAYGMYDFAKARYSNMESTKKSWKDSRSFEENIKKMSCGNPGCSYDKKYDYTAALKDHYSPDLAIEILEKADSIFNSSAQLSDVDIKEYETEIAYDLSTWDDFPGNLNNIGLGSVVLQAVSRNRLGPLAYTGPTEEFKHVASETRSFYQK